MMRFVNGDLFESSAQTLVNTVNCAGVMGKGIALTFKKQYPEMFKDYQQLCKIGKIRPGVLTLYKDDYPWVINFPTKQHWREKSKLVFIELGLQTLVKNFQEWGVTSLALPPLGCGQGGLLWSDVRPLIVKYLSNLDIDIEVYEPGVSTEHKTEIQSLYSTDLFGNPVPSIGKMKKPRRKKRK